MFPLLFLQLLPPSLSQTPSPSSPSPNLLANGGFDNSTTRLSPWTCTWNGNGQVNSTCCGIDSSSSDTFQHSGTSNAFVFQDCRLSQNLTGLTRGATYAVEYFAYCFACTSEDGNIDARFGSTSFRDDARPGSTSSGPYFQYSHRVNASSTSQQISLAFNAVGALRIDTVSVRLLSGNAKAKDEPGVNIGIIVGAAVGGVVVLAVLAGLLWWCCRRRRRARQNMEERQYPIDYSNTPHPSTINPFTTPSNSGSPSNDWHSSSSVTHGLIGGGFERREYVPEVQDLNNGDVNKPDVYPSFRRAR